jgi:hypothetical protein
MPTHPTLPRTTLFAAAMCLAWGACATAPGIPEMARIQCLEPGIAPDPTSGTERIALMDVCWRTAAPPTEAGAAPPASPGDRLIWGRYVAFAEDDR